MEVQEEKEELLVDLAKQAVFEDEADVVVLAGAPLSGLAAKVRDRIPVPVVDCAEAGLRITRKGTATVGGGSPGDAGVVLALLGLATVSGLPGVMDAAPSARPAVGAGH